MTPSPPLALNARRLDPPAAADPPAHLVIAHGLFGSASNWQTVGRRLSERFSVHLLDLRNHGDSPHDPTMDYPAMAQDLARYVDDHCGGQAALVGHSMGGKAAMTTALLFPEKVVALVAADIAPVARLSGFDAYTQALGAIDLGAIRSRSDADGALRQVAPEAGVRAFLLQNLRREGDGWRWRINLPVLAAALPVIAAFPALDARYEGPVLLLRGARSGYVTDQDFESARRFFPAARLQTIDDAGHWLHAEKPAEVAAAISDFLAASMGPGSLQSP